MAKFIIEVRTKGFAVAKADLKEAANQSRKFAREANGAANSSAIFRREVSKLRNNMLLYTFAIAGSIRVMTSFFRASMEFEKTRARLEGLTGSAEEAARTFEIFNEAAKKTQFGIQQITAAGAQLEAFGINSKATIRILSDLASFMGRDIGTAAFAMGRAFSAGAAASEIFREAGVLNIIKTSQGIEDLTKLTLPEFRVAMMKTFVDAASGIQGSTERIQKTTEGMIMNLQDEFVNLQARIGDTFVPALKTVVGALTEFVKSLDTKQVAIMATNITVLTGVLKLNSVGFLAAAKSARTFGLILLNVVNRLAILAAMNIVVTRLVELAQKFELFGMKAEEATENIVDMDKAEQDMIATLEKATGVAAKRAEANEKIAKSIDQSEQSLAIKLLTMQEETELGKARVRVFMEESRSLTANEVALIRAIEAIKEKNKQAKEEIKLAKEKREQELDESLKRTDDHIKKLHEENRIKTTLAQVNNEAIIIQQQLDGATDLELEKMQLKDEFMRELAETVGGTGAAYRIYNETVSTSSSLADIYTEALRTNKEGTDELAKALLELYQEKLKLSEAEAQALIDAAAKKKSDQDLAESARENAKQQRMLASSITLAAGAIKSFGDNSLTAEQKLSKMMQTIGSLLMMMPGGQVAGSFLQAGSMFIGHTGGLIGNNGIQRFAQGGMVQGEDNVPIMAQAGEFIMRRDAVQNIGIENLHAMNQSGTAPVTVNINGGIVQEDFVRNELMPQIHKSMKNDLA